MRRKLEQGPVAHEVEFKCRVYENGRVVADPGTLRQLAGFSEGENCKPDWIEQKADSAISARGNCDARTYPKITTFLREQAGLR